MKWLTWKVQSEPGFRFNIPDLLMILAAAGGTVWLYVTFPESSVFGAPAYLFYSFFLFCNVFRFSNRLEACWYVPFTALTVFTLSRHGLETFWWVVLLVLEPWKWMLVAYGMMRGNYIGAGYKQVIHWRRNRRLQP